MTGSGRVWEWDDDVFATFTCGIIMVGPTFVAVGMIDVAPSAFKIVRNQIRINMSHSLRWGNKHVLLPQVG